MRYLVYFLVVFPFLLSAEKKEVRRIELCQHFFKPNPKDPSILTTPFLAKVKEVLSEKKIELVASDLSGDLTSKEIAYIVLWNHSKRMGQSFLSRLPKEKSILFMWEPPTTLKNMYSRKTLRYFKRIYTWDDDLVDNRRFFKFYYPALTPMIDQPPSFEEKKLLTFIFSNKGSKHPKQLYTERENVIKFFETQTAGAFEFYGQGWEEKRYKNYRGAPENKIEILKNYRFTICYENMGDVKGYITEKIFDSFAAGSVPIYLGATNITDYIPKGCFIDRREFKDNEELYNFLKRMDKTTYDAYIENIRQFLKSDKAQLFSMNMFHVIFLEAIRFP